MSQPTALPLDQALYLQAMNKPVWDELVWKASMGYGVLGQLIDRMNTASGGSQKVNDYIFYNSKLNDRGIFSAINGAPTIVSGTNLNVPISGEPTNFRIRDIVSDDNYVQGRVVGRTTNSIILEPVNVTSFSTATHFLSGTNTRVLFDASGNRCSTGKESLSWVPEKDYGYIATLRDSSHQCKREQVQSWVKYSGGFWYRGWDEMTVNNWNRNREEQYYWSERTIHYAGTANEYMTTGGLRWSIMNNGGSYEALTSQLTLSTFNGFIDDMMIKSTNTGREVILLMGQYFLGNLQGSVFEPYIKAAGTRNTFGGAGVKGLNVMEYAYGGMSLNFAILPLFNNTEKYPAISTITGKNKLAGTGLFMDVASLESYGGASIPSIQKYHFGEKELYAGYMNGLATDFNTGDLASASQSGIISDVMGREFHLAGENGLYVRAQNMGLMELAY